MSSDDPGRVLGDFGVLWSQQSQPVSAPPNAEVPEKAGRGKSGLFPRQGPSGSQEVTEHLRPHGWTHLLLTSMRPSRWTAKSCSLCACFSSSERPYRKWSSPEGNKVTGGAGRGSMWWPVPCVLTLTHSPSEKMEMSEGQVRMVSAPLWSHCPGHSQPTEALR